MTFNTLFFELLQVAIGNRTELSSSPTDEEWKKLLHVSKRQALLGIACFAIVQLPLHQKPQRPTLLRLMGLAEQIKVRNNEIDEYCNKITDSFSNDGFGSCVLKGAGNLLLYPDQLRNYRTSGDIDIWVMPNDALHDSLEVRRRIVAKYCFAKVGPQRLIYHHVDFPIAEIEIEVHFTPSWMKKPIHNKRLQLFFEKEWSNVEKTEKGFFVPSVKMNVVFQLVHIYRHLFNEGIGLRQLLDYYYVLNAQAKQDSEKKRELLVLIDSFGLKRFCGAVMWVLQTVFRMPDEYLIGNPYEKEGSFLLSEILEAGNFGMFDKRKKGVNNIHSFEHSIYKIKRNLRLFFYFPSEVLWAPYFYYVQNYGCWRKGII